MLRVCKHDQVFRGDVDLECYRLRVFDAYGLNDNVYGRGDVYGCDIQCYSAHAFHAGNQNVVNHFGQQVQALCDDA